MKPTDPTTPPAAAETLWYYADPQNQPVGPIPIAELRRLATNGAISAETLVYEEGGSEWQSFATVAAQRASSLSPPVPVLPRIATQKPRRWITIFSLILFYPVGIILLVRNNGFSRPAKIALSVVFLPLFIGLWSPRDRKENSRAVRADVPVAQPVAVQQETAPPPLKLDETGVIAAGAFVFVDAAAKAEFEEAWSSHDAARIKALDESNRAFQLTAPMRGTISDTGETGGVAQVRGWLQNRKRYAYLSERKNISMSVPKVFTVGDEVEVPANSAMFTNRELLLAVRKAGDADDDPRMQVLLPLVEEDTVRYAVAIRAKVIECDSQNGLYKIAGKQPDGTDFERWARARALEISSPLEQKKRSESSSIASTKSSGSEPTAPEKKPRFSREDVEVALRDVESLSVELEELLALPQNGSPVSVENVGRFAAWRSNVRSTARMLETRESTLFSASAKLRMALDDMKFAEEWFNRALQGKSQQEAQEAALVHASHLKMMRSNIGDAKEWIRQEKF